MAMVKVETKPQRKKPIKGIPNHLRVSQTAENRRWNRVQDLKKTVIDR
jgi:hypothetical protein